VLIPRIDEALTSCTKSIVIGCSVTKLLDACATLNVLVITTDVLLEIYPTNDDVSVAVKFPLLYVLSITISLVLFLIDDTSPDALVVAVILPVL